MSITTKCQVLEAGKMRRDAGAFFGELPWEEWNSNFITSCKLSRTVPENMHIRRDRRVLVPANIVYIETESDRILVDTGTPAVHEDQTAETFAGAKLRNQLRTVNAQVKDITKVVLTSFDLDHAGGLTNLGRTGHCVYSFAHAGVYYHANSLQRQRPRTVATASEAVEMLVENQHYPCWETTEIAPGITLHPSYGPSLQGSVLEVCRGAERLLCLGDLCPTVYHVNSNVIPAYDDNPEATYAERMHWIQVAENGGYKVVFSHGSKIKAGWIERTKEGLAVRPA
jgi:glyoxylase-like metal-dependent hydrolase (beta-lactamase superfamily II)